MAFVKKKDQEKKKTEETPESQENKPVSLGLVSDDILLDEVKRRKLGAYDGGEKILVADASDHILITELQSRGIEFNPSIVKLSDNALLLELARRKLGPSSLVKTTPVPAVVKENKLYKAGRYTCRAGRGYNTGQKIYDYGDALILQDDTFLRDLPYLKHFIPFAGTPEPSLTPYGEKFNQKIPKTGAARGANFKNHPALKGQGKAGDLSGKSAGD